MTGVQTCALPIYGITYNNSITYLQGQLLPNVSNISIGSPTQPFQNIYLSNSAVVFSNANVSITGTLFANGTSDFYGPVLFQNQNATPSNGAIEIVASTGFATVSPSANGTMIHVTGFDNTSTKIIQDNFGSGGTYTLFNGRSGRGTAASPSASQAGDILVRFGGNGYGTTGFGIGSGGAYEQYVAAENFSDTTKGTNIVFATTPTGSNVLGTILTLTGNTAIFANNVSIANNFTGNTITANSITISGNTVPTQNNNTWTPNVTFATTQTTYSSSGIVLKTGRQVFATFNVITSGTGAGGVSLNISSIFAATNSGSAVSGTAFVSFLGGSAAPSALGTAITGTMSGPILAGATSIPLYATFTAAGGGGSTTYRQVTGADIGATGQISGHIQYISAS